MNNIVYAGKHAEPLKKVSRHAHDQLELIYCIGGNGRFIFDNCSVDYRAGDIVVIPAKLFHVNISEDGLTNFHVNLSETTISIKEPAVIVSEENAFLKSAFEAVFYYFSSDRELNAPMIASYGRLLATYITTHMMKSETHDISHQIEKNIIDNYTLCDYDLADYLHSLPFSYDYLIKLFKKDMGMTPHKYLTELRLRSAANLLLSMREGNLSISEISRLTGFNEPLYFSRLFRKKFGTSPSYYADMHGKAAPNGTENIRISSAEAETE